MESGEVCHRVRRVLIPCTDFEVRVMLPQNADVSLDPEVLSRRESELKERALRNKVVRTRKRTLSNPPAESSGERSFT